MGLENGLIPSTSLFVSSQKNQEATINAVRMGYPQLWAASSVDEIPWIEIRLSSSKTLTGFEIRGTITVINIQYDTTSHKYNNYAQNV